METEAACHTQRQLHRKLRQGSRQTLAVLVILKGLDTWSLGLDRSVGLLHRDPSSKLFRMLRQAELREHRHRYRSLSEGRQKRNHALARAIAVQKATTSIPTLGPGRGQTNG